MIEKHVEIVGYAGRIITIDYRYKESKKPLIPIIYVHGYKGFKDWGASNIVANTFAEKGFFYLKFNFSHNGVTPDNLLDFSDLEAFGNNNLEIEFNELGLVIDWLELLDTNIQFSKLTVIGHSRGGGITLLRTSQDDGIKKAVTWASVCDFHRRMPIEISEWKETGVRYEFNSRTMQMMPLYYQFYENFMECQAKLDILTNCKNIHQPLLVIHGTDDIAVLLDEAEEISNSVPHSKCHLVEGSGHTFGAKHPYVDSMLTNDLKTIVAESVNFIRDL